MMNTINNQPENDQADHASLIHFLSILGVNKDAIGRDLAQFKTMNVNAGEVLLLQGGEQKYAYFIVSGILKACHYGDSGSILSKEFYFQHELCFLYCSWLTQVPAKYQIESVEDTLLIQVPLELLSHVDWQSAKIALLSQQLIYKEEKEAFFLLNTPEQRYLFLVENRPLWVKKLNNIQLASYIGISPVSLSRLKARL
ncbi:Crp/Fnr family transcriptional regulator [Shewanella psychrophila]|nr:Crp/Fnr family transcriptional regulator [Shewanella psychrophila]